MKDLKAKKGESKAIAGKKPEAEKPARALAQRAIAIAQNSIVKLVRDQTGDAYAIVEANGHTETVRIGGDAFRDWVQGLCWSTFREPLSREPLSQVEAVLNAKARFDGESLRLYNRMARHDGALWLDLCRPDWSAVSITPEGWQVVSKPPIIFRREKHQAAQVVPVSGGDPYRMFEHLLIPDEGQRLLLISCLVAAFDPDISHPLICLHGPQGSSKTTSTQMVRRLIDPSMAEVLSMPRQDELVQQLAHHYMPAYDNIRDLPDWASDELCRAVSGGGASRRKLYSDDADHLFSFRCCPIVNGINVAAQSPDLLDRAVILKLGRIPPCGRKDEDSVWKAFDADRPAIVGGLLDTLSKAMALKPTIEVDELPRMASFGIMGCAVAEALGLTKTAFLHAYERNRGEATREALENDAVAATLFAMMNGRENWEGTASDLLTALEFVAQQAGVRTGVQSWPKSANHLMRRMNVIRVSLAEVGIEVGTYHGTTRTVTIKRLSPERNTPTRDDNDDKDDGLRLFTQKDN